jgi:hypothetical protein
MSLHRRGYGGVAASSFRPSEGIPRTGFSLSWERGVRCPALNRIWSSSTVSLAAVPEPGPQSVHGAAGVPHYDDRRDRVLRL